MSLFVFVSASAILPEACFWLHIRLCWYLKCMFMWLKCLWWMPLLCVMWRLGFSAVLTRRFASHRTELKGSEQRNPERRFSWDILIHRHVGIHVWKCVSILTLRLIVTEIRNERTPQWTVLVFWVSAVWSSNRWSFHPELQTPDTVHLWLLTVSWNCCWRFHWNIACNSGSDVKTGFSVWIVGRRRKTLCLAPNTLGMNWNFWVQPRPPHLLTSVWPDALLANTNPTETIF